MDIKIGANGDLKMGVTAAGDLNLTLVDTEVMTDQSVNLTLHPQALGAALVKLLGGASWAQNLVSFLVTELVALAPKE